MQDLRSHQQDKVVLSSTSLKIIFRQVELCQHPPYQWQKARVEPHSLAILNSVMCHIPLINTNKTQLIPSVSRNLLEIITKAEVSGNIHKYWGSWLMSSAGHCFCKVMVIRKHHWWLRQSKYQSYLQEQGGGSGAPQDGKTHQDLLEGDTVNSSWKPFPGIEGQDESSLHKFMAGKSHCTKQSHRAINNTRWDKSWCVHPIWRRVFGKPPTPSSCGLMRHRIETWTTRRTENWPVLLKGFCQWHHNQASQGPDISGVLNDA